MCLPGRTAKMDSLARVNYLHERYRKAGKITDEENAMVPAGLERDMGTNSSG
ncbi:hypothetical protein F5X96DRAFT_624485 [Biscogniauxia mediterranea]|nr:hypothetical protein F5X96DRAFT_624485 [Biscogniauxia mediterranea]